MIQFLLRIKNSNIISYLFLLNVIKGVTLILLFMQEDQITRTNAIIQEAYASRSSSTMGDVCYGDGRSHFIQTPSHPK